MIALLVTAFLLSLGLFLILAKRNIALAMFIATLTLGLLSVPLNIIARDLAKSFQEPKILSLAFATSLIPLIGGLMNDTGLMDEMLRNLKIQERYFLGISPAIVGMLPMPGGALLSAPIVEKIGGEKVSKEIKATANVWFRHIFILIYPMSAALIISTEISGVDMYEAISYLLIFALISAVIGYFFYLRYVPSGRRHSTEGSFKKFLKPFMVLIIAPIIDFSIKNLIATPLKTYSTLIAVLSSFIILLIITKPSLQEIKKSAKKMGIWDFFFLIIFIEFYLYIFLDSGLGEIIRSIQLHPIILFIIIPFSLGFVTGRVMTPASILYPIYIAKLGTITPIMFTATYVAIFMGYMISPVHPCLVLTAKYFDIDVKEITKRATIPALIISIIATVLLII